MFKMLAARVIEDSKVTKESTAFFIEHGYLERWNPVEHKESDRGLKQYSTATRWEQYSKGKISREKAVELAVKRMIKKEDKRAASALDRLEKVAAAPDVNYIAVNVEYKRSTVWGYNPSVDTTINTDWNVYTGYASGCGYDKESAAVADSFNKCLPILKELYTLKEKALQAGVSDHSKTACTGVNNTACVGYGAGYTVIPYFEGGVGVDCFWSILKKAGFNVSCNYGKRENLYRITRGME